MITAISPLDGRYASKTADLQKYFSEYALIYYRVLVEIRWFQHIAKREDIAECRNLTEEENQILEEILLNFSEDDALRVKEIEKTTNHDVKAVEYLLKEKLSGTVLEKASEWIHFACTSEDINNLSYALMLRDSIKKVILPTYDVILETLEQKSIEWKSIPLLSLTHGQSASPTTLGKTIFVFAARLSAQLAQLESQDFLGKINGATGNFNAHVIAYPDANWLEISQSFVEGLGLQWNPFTDQIDPHDFIAEISHICSRSNTILIDFSRDIWGYIARGVFGQKTKEGEIGSSAMPHKVNPIDFENAEGNFGMANALFGFFADKLPISRWQRDLTDSTVLRNLGVSFGHTILALQSLNKGISKLKEKPENMKAELDKNVEVLAEAVQTVMRKHSMEKLVGIGELQVDQLLPFNRQKQSKINLIQIVVRN
ncbi:TPA: adenylosuccinate lyase [Candidatus Peregrinibacteria bacterium]|nr:adenylosuccinate lyase [Candidatus Peregrinibacteria bacterium]